MKVLFLILMGLLLALLPLCVKSLLSKKNILSSRMFKILALGGISVASHMICICASNERLALVAYSVYFASVAWLTTFIFLFCIHYTDKKTSRKVCDFLVLPLTIVDTLALFANNFFQFMFSVYYIRWGH